jgi:hypothetical protein
MIISTVRMAFSFGGFSHSSIRTVKRLIVPKWQFQKCSKLNRQPKSDFLDSSSFPLAEVSLRETSIQQKETEMNERIRELCKLASVECDSTKLIELTMEINELRREEQGNQSWRSSPTPDLESGIET